MRKWLLLSLLLVLGLAKPVYRWVKDCSHWSPMEPLDYWLTVRTGCCYEIVETRDEYACLVLQLEEGQQFHRVDRKVMTREVQEESYRIAVQRAIDLLRKSLARRNDPDPRERNYAQQGISMGVRSLRDFTGLSTAEPEKWIRWWEDYHQWLRLTPDGRHLVVDPSSPARNTAVQSTQGSMGTAYRIAAGAPGTIKILRSARRSLNPGDLPCVSEGGDETHGAAAAVAVQPVVVREPSPEVRQVPGRRLPRRFPRLRPDP